MTMNNKDLITIFASFFIYVNFILLKKIKNHINHIIKKLFFSYMLYFDFFKGL